MPICLEEVADPAPSADVDEQIEARPHKKSKKRKKRSYNHIPRRAYRREEFCAAHRISRTHYYKLREDKLGPHETDVGGVTLITEEDAARWRKQRSAASKKGTAA
jgi:hypothetical protein